MRRHTVKMLFFFQPEALRMTMLGRLTTLTHLDDVMVTEEEAAEAVHTAAGSRINQVKFIQIQKVDLLHKNKKKHAPVKDLKDLYALGCAVIQSDLLTLCSQASLLAHSHTNSDRPRSLSLLSTAQLLCHLRPAPWGLDRELEVDWTAQVSNGHVGLSEKKWFLKMHLFQVSRKHLL